MNFHVQTIEWNPDGRSVLVMDHEKFCIGFPVDGETEFVSEVKEETTDEAFLQERFSNDLEGAFVA